MGTASLSVAKLDEFVAWAEEKRWKRVEGRDDFELFRLTCPRQKAAVFRRGAMHEVTTEDVGARLVRTWASEKEKQRVQETSR